MPHFMHPNGWLDFRAANGNLRVMLINHDLLPIEVLRVCPIAGS